MTAWTSGYVADIGYSYGFYRELTPELLSFVVLSAGQEGPRSGAPLTICELGCGQGLSMNLLAAANPQVVFHATDFNPSHIAGARALAADTGLSNVTFYDHSFADFADAPGLPDSFDIILLHGIYSWVSAENRAAIVDFIRSKLKVGGLVYVSYNALPGWAAAAPMRHLMYLHGKTKGGPTIGRVEPALAFVDQMLQANAAFFRVNPSLKERFEKLKEKDRNYLAHEYFNEDWTLFYHSEVAEEMAAAKLTYLGSADLLDAINLTAEQQQILTGIDDPVLKETVQDFMTNQQFRRDVFVKGPVPLTPRAAQDAWRDRRFALSVNRADIEPKVKGLTLRAEVYDPILDKLAEGPRTLRELVADKAIADLGWARLQRALAVLVGVGYLQPCLPAKDEAKRAKGAKAFNHAVIQRARDSGDLQFLASPVTGGGLRVRRFPLLLLLALSEGKKQPDEWAEFAWQWVPHSPETAEQKLAEVKARAATFAEKQLPVLRSLQVI